MPYDIHFQILSLTQSPGDKPFGFGFISAVGVRGPQLMINRWVKCLMTQKGSNPFNKNYGTGFPSLFGSNITTMEDLMDAITIFVDDCNTQMIALDTLRKGTADETFANATIAALNPNDTGDGFDLYVFIQNAAGIQVQVGLPSIITR